MPPQVHSAKLARLSSRTLERMVNGGKRKDLEAIRADRAERAKRDPAKTAGGKARSEM